jgi:hypothetical protein
MFKKTIFPIISILILAACKDDRSKLFTRLEEGRTGINFRNLLQESEEMNLLVYSYFYNGAGVAIGDINDDGLQDIFFSGNMVKNRLFLNKGNFKFEDITEKSGVAEKQGWCTGTTMVDVNTDGRVDIYVCRSADVDPARRKNLLFINNGDLTFTEKAETYGLADEGYSTQASFFDYDKDGDLDMFLINHSLQQYTTGAQESPGIREQKNPQFANKLFKNNNGLFSDVSDQAGITSNVLTFGLGVAISDIDKDGWPDIHVSNDFNEPDYLFINNRDGTFSEKLKECMDQASLFSMGSDFADYDNDGLTDLVTLDMLAEDNKTQKMHSGAENFDKFQMLFTKGFYYQFSRNMLHKNNGDGTFSEIGQLAGISNTDWSWASLFSDFDNDGYKDLFVTNGYVKDNTDMDFLKYTIDQTIKARQEANEVVVSDFIARMPTIEIPNYVFQNQGNGSFVKRTTDWGLDQKSVSAGAAYADLDNDGDMDLVVSNTNDYAGIYRNNSEELFKNNFLKIKLEGDAKNELGIGAKITLHANGNIYYQEQIPVRGFQSSTDPVLNFGIGKNPLIDSLTVVWPNDRMQKIHQVKANQILTVKFKDATLLWKPDSTATQKKYFKTDSSISFKHTENQFNDFTVQTLLLNYFSRQGPCIQKADVNKDGREDIFIGGAKGQPSEIFLQTSGGQFRHKPQPAFAETVASEIVSAVFFDADDDDDMDLYMGSGGYEFANADPVLQDHLFINDGAGNFTKKIDALPQMFTSTGCVTSADVDADGDIDLFAGGRVVPGKYPVSPESYLLLNDGKGNFSDATDAIAPGLKNVGMVTDALWMDINKDGKNDLIVVGEWMPVKVFINDQNLLKDETNSYIKFISNGWWNKIYADDFDGDGDKDLVIGNIGLNTQFHSNEKEPLQLYYKDFDANGSIDPIFCYYINGRSYPANSRDDLTEQLPMLKKKFLEYHQYANATIYDIFTPEQLKDAGVLSVTEQSTIYLQNDGAKGFTKKNLPIQAQYAPVYAITSLDADKDGKKDLVLAGNNSWTRIKFGLYSANHGILMTGDGKGNFTYIPQWRSGFNIRQNVRSLEVVSAGKEVRLIFGINNGSVKTHTLQ